MKWGNIHNDYIGFGWKRLSSHEINPSISNGHEFQGVKALTELLGNQRLDAIPTCYYLIGDDPDGNPIVYDFIRSTASWYDSREHQKHRAPEWRLYYPAEAGRIQVKCHEGDLMVIGKRKDSTLSVFLIEANSCADASIVNLLGIGRVQERGKGNTRVIDAVNRDIGLSASETLEYLAFSMSDFVDAPPPFSIPEPKVESDVEVDVIATKMIEQWPGNLGSCQDVSDLVVSHCSFDQGSMVNEPDAALMRWLEAAEASYRIWESQLLSGFLKPLRFDKGVSDEDLAEAVSKKWMSIRQGRVSRAGRMMELFLVEIFKAAELKFDWGGKIEGGKLPDFIFPGVNEYRNTSFPASDLRILGSKTSFKDRWRQILAEADRVNVKHGVTRDNSITKTIFAQMEAASFVVVMPKAIKDTYSSPPRNLISLAEFINDTRTVCCS
ncbi:MAG: hypothetical protein LAT58_08770 [Opitutales bacterium]|nr:hypothetical protein [Opitutales bacterium]